MPIKVEIHGISQVDKLADLFNRSRAILMDKLMEGSKKFAFEAQGITKRDYFSKKTGKGGFNEDRLISRTGRLRSSITSDVKRSGETIEISQGTDVVYAPVHELGFHGMVTVPAHNRVVKKAFGRDIGVTVANVRSHQRLMNIRKRPFLRPGLEEAMPAFELRIQNILAQTPFGEASGE